MKCDVCDEVLSIETLLTKEGIEIELTYCKNCKILCEVTLDGYNNEIDMHKD